MEEKGRPIDAFFGERHFLSSTLWVIAHKQTYTLEWGERKYKSKEINDHDNIR